MLSPITSDAFVAPETQDALSLPMAVLILRAVSQVESLIELTDRVCNTAFCRRVNMKAECDIVSRQFAD